MQKNEFFQKLNEHLNFLTDSDAKAVIEFYESKFSDATSPEEEERLIKSFGDVSVIAKNIKFDFIQPQKTSTPISSEHESEDFDLIFSKPHASSTVSEIIHSFENKEMKTLYGEKVVVEKRKLPTENLIIDPVDENNGFTPEEIEHAKEETLEKASKFNTQALNIEEETIEEQADAKKIENSEKIMIEEDDSEVLSQPAIFDAPEKNGLLVRLFTRLRLPKSSFMFLSVLLSIIISPVLITVFALCVSAYTFVSALIILAAALLFVLMVLLIVLGVLELVYGFLVLFDNVTIALIELGLGTVLFALVTAIAALSYEFIFGITPRILKKITAYFKSNLKKLTANIYGGIR